MLFYLSKKNFKFIFLTLLYVEEDIEGEDEEINELTPRSLKARVELLSESICYEGFAYTRRGLFVKHRLLVATML